MNFHKNLVVQPFWTANVSSFKCHDDVEFCAPFSHKTLVSRKPDVIIKKKGQDPVPFNVIAVGELKGSRIDKDADEHLGQIEHYLSLLLKQQPFRYRALGFLTNYRVIHVVEAQKVDLPINHVKFVWFIRESFEKGRHWLGFQIYHWISMVIFCQYILS